MNCYVSQGLKVQQALKIAGITKHQYYHRPKQGKRGRNASLETVKLTHKKQEKVMNTEVVKRIEAIKKDPDTDYGYRAMSRALQQEGYHLNHKKVYRLMKENALLKEKHKTMGKTYVKYRKVHPTRVLEVLEMDIKIVWVESEKKYAFVLNIVDTFSRKWLYQSVGFSIKAAQIKQAWEHLIVNHLQPNDGLSLDLHIEIRNDNDKRFSAQIIQDFFKENHLNQVFTHPYTPQENGHVESFHGILDKHLERFNFWDIKELEQNLILFQEKYNNQRLHGSLAHLCPNDFEALWHQGLITISSQIKHKVIKFKLNIAYQEVYQFTGNNEPEGSLSPKFSDPPDRAMEENFSIEEMSGANISNNLRYKKSPSVVSRDAKISTDFCNIVNQK